MRVPPVRWRRSRRYLPLFRGPRVPGSAVPRLSTYRSELDVLNGVSMVAWRTHPQVIYKYDRKSLPT